MAIRTSHRAYLSFCLKHVLFKPLNTKLSLNCISSDNSYRTVNTLRLCHKSQLLGAAQGNTVCSETHTKHMHALCGQYVQLLNLNLVVHLNGLKFEAWKAFKPCTKTVFLLHRNLTASPVQKTNKQTNNPLNVVYKNNCCYKNNTGKIHVFWILQQELYSVQQKQSAQTMKQ
jgi:hypothetical protein